MEDRPRGIPRESPSVLLQNDTDLRDWRRDPRKDLLDAVEMLKEIKKKLRGEKEAEE